MPDPECTCTFTEHTSKFDPACFYHGDNGTMVSTVSVGRYRRTMAEHGIPVGVDWAQVIDRAIVAFLTDRKNPQRLDDLKAAHREYRRATTPTNAA